MTEMTPIDAAQPGMTGLQLRQDLPDEVVSVLDVELLHLYDDLNDATKTALDGQWSMKCDWLVDRIRNLLEIGGEVPPMRGTVMTEKLYRHVGMRVGGRWKYEDAEL